MVAEQQVLAAWLSSLMTIIDRGRNMYNWNNTGLKM